MDSVVKTTPRGLYCAAGKFYIDPWAPVKLAVITHGHTDHARWGHQRYLSTPTCATILEARFGPSIVGKVQSLPYGQPLVIGGVELSFHPAGHVLGSAQVRLLHRESGRVWVISGDYKTCADGVSEPFEPVRCNTFITESTFGLPIYRWPSQADVRDSINRWWASNAASGRPSVIGCYALGKAQRIMAGLDETVGPILLHGALESCTQAYRRCGVRLPPSQHATQKTVRESKGRAIVLAPPSALRSPWAFNLVKSGDAGQLATAMASGWMQLRGTRRRRLINTGFTLSDHADWLGLMSAIDATGADSIGVTHGAIGPMVRYLNERGRQAFAVPTKWEGELADDSARTDDEGIELPAHIDHRREEVTS